MAKKKSDLAPRLVTAGVAIPILLYIIFIAPKWAFFALVGWASATSVWEFCNIVYGDDVPGAKWFSSALGLGVYTVIYYWPDHVFGALAGAALASFLFFLFRYTDQKKATLQMGTTVAAIVYGGVLLAGIALLNRDTGAAGPLWIIIVLFVVWMSDTGAYFTGRAFGKRKLYEAVSPNKSIEGAIGGFVISVGVVIGCNYAFGAWVGAEGVSTELFGLSFLSMELEWQTLGLGQILLVAIPANILGQCGDLVESLVKRAHDVKDSGTIIYGHGGMLDRIDALIFASPWVYYCVSKLL